MKNLRIVFANKIFNKKTKVVYSNGSVRAVGIPFEKKTPTEKTMKKIIRKSNCRELLDQTFDKIKRLKPFK